MSRQALYRAWRPQTFDEVVAQEAVVQTLRQALLRDELAHAYLFCGTRGTGKTSLAKILARAINCLNPSNGNPCNHCTVCEGILDASLLDVQEIDAASNNSVDNVRRLIEEIQFLPIRAKRKVYIIDEVHMLSTGAFNALLKTLEEPPKHALFILATTEVHRLPATILSRCQRFDFKRIPAQSLFDRLFEVAKGEGIAIRDEAIWLIVRQSDGALRDALSLLDQCHLSFPTHCSADDVLSLVGSVNKLFYANLAEALVQSDAFSVLQAIEEVLMEGRDLTRFTLELADFYRDLLLAQTVGASHELILANQVERARLAELAPLYKLGQTQLVLSSLQTLANDLRFSPQARTTVELALLTLPQRLKKNLAQGASAVTSATLQATTAQSLSTSGTITTAQSAPEQLVTTVVQSAPETLTLAETQSTSETLTTTVAQPASETPVTTVIQPATEAFTTETAPLASAVEGVTEVEQDIPSLSQDIEELEPAKVIFAPVEELEKAPFELVLEERLGLSPSSGNGNSESLASLTEARTSQDDSSDFLELWKRCLELLEKQDLYLYFFAREASPRADEGRLWLDFTPKQKSHYNVLASPQGKLLHQLWERLAPRTSLSLQLLEGAEEAEDGAVTNSWLERIREAAKGLDLQYSENLDD